MGWNTLNMIKDSKLISTNDPSEYYFVHSYFVQCNNRSDIVSNTKYDNEFVSFFNKENIFGVQFHPEKSHNFGKSLFRKVFNNVA